MRGHARDAGLENAIVFNTCAVTAEAERQARQAIRRARPENHGATIIVPGCAAQIDPAGFPAMPAVDRVLGKAMKLAAHRFLPHPPPPLANDLMTVPANTPHPIQGLAGLR